MTSAALAYALPDEPEVIATSAGELDASDIVAESWRRGDIDWKLDPHQLVVIEQFEAWDARRQEADYGEWVESIGAQYDSVFVDEAGRRVGKTHRHLVRKISASIRRPGASLTYATAFQKDIGEIIVPLADIICEDAPDDVRPVYRKSQGEGHEGLYFPNGSVIKLVGVDKHPDALRGRFSDGMTFSEAGFMRKLAYLITSVVLPQFQRRPWASLVLESSTPKDPEHELLTVFVEDAKKRGAYSLQTIDDNHAIAPHEKAKAIREAGGRGNPNCEREYYCARERDPETVVVPEFSRGKHVRLPPSFPAWLDCYVAMDPGQSDKCAILWAYWDFERAKLVIQRSWAESNASPAVVADVLRETERELWSDAQSWDATRKAFRDQPFLRVSDIDLTLINALHSEHGIVVTKTAKDDAEAQLFALRTAVGGDKIEVVPNSGPLEAQLVAATRKDGGGPMDWQRSDAHGHFDCVAALMYLWRNVIRTRNPIPPEWVTMKGDKFVEPHAERTVPKPVAKVARLIVGGPRR